MDLLVAVCGSMVRPRSTPSVVFPVFPLFCTPNYTRLTVLCARGKPAFISLFPHAHSLHRLAVAFSISTDPTCPIGLRGNSRQTFEKCRKSPASSHAQAGPDRVEGQAPKPPRSSSVSTTTELDDQWKTTVQGCGNPRNARYNSAIPRTVILAA